MDPELEAEVGQELRPGEQLLWTGRPGRGLRPTAVDVVRLPLNLMWMLFAVAWLVVVIREEAGAPFALVGVAFVLIGLYMVLGRFMLDKYRRSKIYYALTNKRVVIIICTPGRNVESIDLGSLGHTAYSTDEAGRGTIIFGADAIIHSGYAGPGWPSPPEPRFEYIDNVQDVYEEISKARAAVRG